MSSPRLRPGRPLRVEQLEDRLTPTTLPSGFRETILTGSLSQPTAMEVAPDGRVFVLEQTGNVRILKNGQLLATPFVSLNVDSQGERGLLGIAFDPDFASSSFVYLYYTTTVGGVHNRVSRFTANGDLAVAGSELPILNLEPVTHSNHNGGAIHFGSDGMLYVAVGEDGTPANSQTLSNRLGKMLRIDRNGGIPADNPFVDTPGADAAIWALGLRNPFTFGIQPGTGRIFINDVGAGAFEEINVGSRGANYGWPLAEGPSTRPGLVNPLFPYPHGSGTSAGFAITGGSFYNPAAAPFGQSYIGDYFFADLANNWIRRFDPITRSVTLFASNTTALPVDLKVDAAGNLLYLARGNGGNTGVLARIDAPAAVAARRFVNALYVEFLGRPAPLAQQEALANQIPQIGRAGLIRAIQMSRESLSRKVDSYFRFVLNRPAGPNGAVFVDLMQRHGWTAERVLATLLASQEYFQRANALEGTANANVNFARSLFPLFLARTGTPQQVSTLVGALPGQGRVGVATWFQGFFETRSRFIEALFGTGAVHLQIIIPNLMNRTSPLPAAFVRAWATSPYDLLSLERLFASSNEYYLRG